MRIILCFLPLCFRNGFWFIQDQIKYIWLKPGKSGKITPIVGMLEIHWCDNKVLDSSAHPTDTGCCQGVPTAVSGPSGSRHQYHHVTNPDSALALLLRVTDFCLNSEMVFLIDRVKVTWLCLNYKKGQESKYLIFSVSTQGNMVNLIRWGISGTWKDWFRAYAPKLMMTVLQSLSLC